MSPASLWPELTTAQTTASGLVERRLSTARGCDLFVAIRKPGNQRLVIARVHGIAPKTIDMGPQSRGISTTLIEGDQLQELQVGLVDDRFAEMFDALIADLAQTMSYVCPPTEALARIVSRIRTWQQFFADVEPEGLSFERLRGLFGELWFLREHLLGSLGAGQAVEAWKGSAPAEQDFQLPGCAIEAKTTGTALPQRLHIASERQLDSRGVERLILFHLSVDVRDGGGLTLPRLVSDIRSYLSGMPAAEFDDKLLAYGYSDVHAKHYASSGFTVRESNLFEVRESFPRIIETDVRPGVGDVRYTILVDTLRPYAIEVASLRQILHGVHS